MSRDVSLFDRFAQLYDLLMPRPDGRRLRAALQHAERPVARMLDVGGGTGRTARELGATVVDAAPGMARRARRKGLSVMLGDATQLPIADETMDGVVVVDALHHLPDRVAVVGEAARVLRPGGGFVVCDFDPTTLRGRGLGVAERVIAFDSVFLTPPELGELMADAGFEVTVIERGFAYTVVGVKPTAAEPRE